MTIFIDLETRSAADLKAVGAWKYSEDKYADVLLLCYYYDFFEESTVLTWSPGDPVPIPFFDESVVFVARNWLFEYAMTFNVLVKKYGFPPEMTDINRWRCTRAMCLQAGLPGSLDDSARVLKTTNQKQKEKGTRLINLYSKPVRKLSGLYFREMTAEDFDDMIEYCRADVETDREIYNRLKNLPNVKTEYETFLLDGLQNIKGLRIDIPALDKVLSVLNETTKRAEAEQADAGLNTRSGPQLIAYLKENGIDVNDAQADTLAEIYDDAPPEVQNVLALRLFLSRASFKKFKAAKDRVSFDGRLRYFLRYFGAHTGRWTSEGVQIHNLPKTYGEPVTPEKIDTAILSLNAKMPYTEIISECKKILPGLIIPDEGKTFIAGDFAAIEARLLAYLAGCGSMVEAFRNGKDIYKQMAARVFGCGVDEIDKPKRQLGKMIILGCGYGMGFNKFLQACHKSGLKISEELAEKSVKYYRDTFQEIPAFWRDIENAFRNAVTSGASSTVGRVIIARQGKVVTVTLPSSRVMYYHGAEIVDGKMQYMNYSQRKTCYVYGGVLVENIVQATARDILTDCMSRLLLEDIYPAFHVHDECIAEIPLDKAEDKKILFDNVMNTAPAWLPGFPLSTESAIISRYRK